MSFEMKGKIKKIFDQQDFPSGFYKRDFVITTEEQYPQDVKFTATKERTEQISKFNEGDAILVKFDIRGREYNGNFYVDLNAWRVEPGHGQSAPQDSPPVASTPLPDVPPMAAADDEDDLPF
ncbi:MAG: DUF3127 domain-containing protein [Bacteroidetes bacterium]|nr:DUF3127 domain-containing protein [Bacteroidota bacterium]MDA1335303.1 DUF3127 domain-containing protein [Bacteroidota bacterium]